jgi:hypothetical protein
MKFRYRIQVVACNCITPSNSVLLYVHQDTVRILGPLYILSLHIIRRLETIIRNGEYMGKPVTRASIFLRYLENRRRMTASTDWLPDGDVLITEDLFHTVGGVSIDSVLVGLYRGINPRRFIVVLGKVLPCPFAFEADACGLSGYCQSGPPEVSHQLTKLCISLQLRMTCELLNVSWSKEIVNRLSTIHARGETGLYNKRHVRAVEYIIGRHQSVYMESELLKLKIEFHDFVGWKPSPSKPHNP